jgi:hypothetical protein
LEREWKKISESTDMLTAAGKMAGAVLDVYDEHIEKNVGRGVHLGSLHTVVDYARFVMQNLADVTKAYAYLDKVAVHYTHLDTTERLCEVDTFSDFDGKLDRKIDAKLIKLNKRMLRTLVHGNNEALQLVSGGFQCAVELADAIERSKVMELKDLHYLVEKLHETRAFVMHRGTKVFTDLEHDADTVKKRIGDLVAVLTAAGFTAGLTVSDLPYVNVLIDTAEHFVPDPSKPLKRLRLD